MSLKFLPKKVFKPYTNLFLECIVPFIMICVLYHDLAMSMVRWFDSGVSGPKKGNRYGTSKP